MTASGKVVILGGGIAGLSAACRAMDLGLDPVVYEASARPGGLLDSFEIETPEGRWLFDNAVHLSFATEDEVRAVFDKTPYLEHEARSLNWDEGHWIPHPVQNNLYSLPVEEKIDLISSFSDHLANLPAIDRIGNYRDWLVYQYGGKIAERWPLRYTKKYWTLDAEALGTDWIGSRMRPASMQEILRGALSERAPNTYYVSTMRYPAQGGYRAFLTPLLEKTTVKTGYRALSIDNKAGVITFANGEVCRYDAMISTIPLPSLIDLMLDVPAEIRGAAASLFATSIDLVSLGLRKPDASPSLWFYIYDEDILAARVYSPSWKSSENAPAGHTSLQFEIYSSRHWQHGLSADELIGHCIEALIRMKIATRDDVVFSHHKYLPFGNVVFDQDMECRRDLVRRWVESEGIMLAGRFGEWDYLWSNQAFMSGRRAAEKLRP